MKDSLVPWFVGINHIDEKINLLKKYHQYLPDRILFDSYSDYKNFNIISRIQDLGFEVMPIVDVKDDKSIDWVEERKDEFPIVFIGSFGAEYEFDFDKNSVVHARVDPEHMRAGRKIIDEYKDRFGSIGFNSFETFTESEAWQYRHNLEQAPLRNYIKNSVSMCITFWGVWCLFKDFTEQAEYGYDSSKRFETDGPWIDPRDRTFQANRPSGMYPFQYYLDYINGLPIGSGIGYTSGAERGNLKKLKEVGYQYVMFSVPNNEQDMETYLTGLL